MPSIAQVNRDKTHCMNGHEFSIENTEHRKSGKYTLRRCKICHRTKNVRRYHENSDYRQSVISRASIRQSKGLAVHKKAWAFTRRLQKYGITLEQYNIMLQEQNFCCYICGTNGILCIDHSHKTKQVRRLLCRNCNLAIGNFREKPDIMRKAADYVDSFKDR